ncbi:MULTISPECIES: DUF2474 domain-containing protein [Alcaligenaceae]|jgi:hypothetical protein|uniref:DUF2474 domain-containing protein n=1 Tax=Neopusillimonas maritima TaxID=2026239 RepID=A0ABX9MXM5_9BURK|nr:MULTISPECIES: DUF2474 domain-containing protein [Alcaligenaceae]MAL00627.1 DUF2474 domain-containing protein [Alcaligenaceae bacterium]MBF24691.1 DUF2474 domain-containing protein [Pusillimonas sp.]QIM49752.1 DUF2474 domain-containing protein [Pusillimonas sp. DMV24BSW_D]RII82232.1 DUF2474 domain-containing protein [Neopusillimonas maritima]
MSDARKPWLKRLGWLVALWFGGVAALTVFALVLRWIMSSIGMTT